VRVRGTLSRVDGQLLVTEPKTAKSKRFVPISEPAEQLLRRIQANQDKERSRAGSAWRQTGFVFTPSSVSPAIRGTPSAR
jgi:integrase